MMGVSAPELAKFLKEQFPNDNIQVDDGETILVSKNEQGVYLIEWIDNRLTRIRARGGVYDSIINTLDIRLGCHPDDIGKDKRIFLLQKRYIIEVEL